MDIGNQQRVIIVELEEAQTETPELQPAAADTRFEELVGDWPLPLDINVEHTPAN